MMHPIAARPGDILVTAREAVGPALVTVTRAGRGFVRSAVVEEGLISSVILARLNDDCLQQLSVRYEQPRQSIPGVFPLPSALPPHDCAETHPQVEHLRLG